MSAKLYPDQSAAYIEQQVFEERHEASLERTCEYALVSPVRCHGCGGAGGTVTYFGVEMCADCINDMEAS